MKVYIGKYPKYFSSYGWERAYFEKKYGFDKALHLIDEDYTKLDKFVVKFLDIWDTVICTPLNKLQRRERKVKVRIDDQDVWSFDDTLAHIILPGLVKLYFKKHGAPNVDDEDVPALLQYTPEEIKKQKETGDVGDKHFKRWDWILGEMIFSFNMKVNDDWMNSYYENNDRNGLIAVETRIDNGFRLFGKYYQNLWD